MTSSERKVDSKRQSSSKAHREVLETVKEASHEASQEQPDKRKSTESPVNFPPKYKVEKFEFRIEADDEFEAAEALSKRAGLPPKTKRKSMHQVHTVVEELPSNDIPGNWKPQSQRENQQFFFSPRQTGAVPNFFTQRKVSVKSPKGTGDSKIKIVNNIFQNTFLQKVVKKPEGNERGAGEMEFFKKASNQAGKKQSNLSLEISHSIVTSNQGSNVKQSGALFLSPKAKGVLKEQSFTSPKRAMEVQMSKATTKESASDVKKELFKSFDSSQKRPREGQSVGKGALKELKQFKEFHQKLNELILDLGQKEYIDTNDEMNLKQSWRFVKDLVQGYVQAKEKIQALEQILRQD
jgi:hypothetical protein